MMELSGKMRQSALMINREINIGSIGVVNNWESSWISTLWSFINGWDTDPVDGAMVFKWGANMAPMLGIFFLHLWGLCQPSLLLLFLGSGLKVKFEV